MVANNMDMAARLCERIKNSPLGDLITEEDLRETAIKAMDKAFFEPRREVGGTEYHRTIVDKPPLIVELLQEVLREKMKERVEVAVTDWFDKNPEKVLELFTKTFEAGILTSADAIITAHTMKVMRPFLEAIMEPINRERGTKGLPYLHL